MWNYLTSGAILTIITSTLINVHFTELTGEVLGTHTFVGAHSVLLHARENAINDNDDNITNTHGTSGSISTLIQACRALINILTAMIPLKPCQAVTGVRCYSILCEGSIHRSLQSVGIVLW